jgi:hypothetical protein
MFIYRLAEPVDLFDGLTPLPDWLKSAGPHETKWALQAVLALADAAATIGWAGEMRHLPSIGVALTPPGTTRYLIVKQDNNGDTFIITAAEAPWIATDAVEYTTVEARQIGAWTHPTTDDIPTQPDGTLTAGHQTGPGDEPPF